MHIVQRITVIVYPSHQPTHSDPHFTSPETRINTGFLPFVNFYGLPLTFTPAAADTIAAYLSETATLPSDYDLIATGDLGAIGSSLFVRLLEEKGIDLCGRHKDCGLLIYDRKKQDTHSGGSGCGCSASVLCSYILKKMEKGEWKKVLFMATGALMSTTSNQQCETIPSIAHLISFIKE